MKLNIANPAEGTQKLLDIDDEKKLRIFYDKRMSQEVKGDDLGEEFRGYVFRITGGNDKQGFPMKQGVLVNKRVRLLMGLGHSCFRPRRTGERQRKSIRGCIVGADLAVLSLVIVKPGSQNLPGLTDKTIPRRLGPKRASKIRKLFNLGKQDDVRKSVIRRDIPAKEGKKKGTTKSAKIQRLVTPLTLQRKRRRLALKKRWSTKSKKDAEDYKNLLQQRQKESREKRQEIINKKRGIVKPATPAATPTPATTATPAKKVKKPTTESGKKDTKPATTTTTTTTPATTVKPVEKKGKAGAAKTEKSVKTEKSAKTPEKSAKASEKPAAAPTTTAAPATTTAPAKAAEPTKKEKTKPAESTKKEKPAAATATTTTTTATATTTAPATTAPKPVEPAKPAEPAKKGGDTKSKKK